ncbi:ATP-grasp domain-containing protein [uncultured Methanobrevibacter sp.]|uniref:ATP-grasp domain-containing protein n=1 Tax=uncultured Methanobrevibacter sp. TaxID=253161 RepID=UPI00260CAA54
MSDLKNVNQDSILIFEYFTSSGVTDLSIVSEAEEIIRSLAIELRDKDIYVLVSKEFEDLFDDLDFDVKTIVIGESLEGWLENNAEIFSKAMFVASEANMDIYNFTKILESKNVSVYGSDSYSVKLCSDKYEIFDYLGRRVRQPMTFNILLNSKTYWKRAIQIFFDTINGDYGDSQSDSVPIMQKPRDIPVLDNSDREIEKEHKLIAKPRFGVDCENIKLISSKLDIDELENIYDDGSRFVIQEFIEGDVCSVSLISDGKTAVPISLNKQVIEITDEGGKYVGGCTPYENPFKNQAFELAKKACEFIPGLKGFIGVDLIITEEGEVYLIEINSRFTTSYVGLQKIADFNIASSIIDLLDGNMDVEELERNISYNSKVHFLKDENGILDINIE